MTSVSSSRKLESSSASRTLIHLGLPKTATTYLQMFLFARHSEIVYLGKMEGDPLFCTPTIKQLVWSLRHPSHRLKPGLVEKARREVDRLRQPGTLLVLSDEGFTFSGRENKHQQARAMHSIFGDCQILLTIRKPLSFMETLYFQELRGYHYHPESFGRLVKRFGRPPRFFDMEDWLSCAWSSKHHGAFDHLMVHDTASAYAEVFGRSNIIVKVYEDMIADNSGFIQNLSSDLGIDAEESVRLCENQGAAKNARWRQEHVDRLKMFNRSFLLHWTYRLFKSRRDLKEFLGVTGPGQIVNSPVAQAHIPTPWRERILEISRSQYGRLAADWKLPLDEHGYPLPDDRVPQAGARTEPHCGSHLRRSA